MPTFDPANYEGQDRLAHIEKYLAQALAATASSGVSEYTLGAPASAGSTTLTLDRNPTPMIAGRNCLILIDPFKTTCQLRAATAFSGSTITIDSQLLSAVAQGAPVWFWFDDVVPVIFFGAVDTGSSSLDNIVGIQKGVDETYAYGIWLSGQGHYNTFRVSAPLFCGPSAHLKDLQMNAITGGVTYGPADATNAMVMSCQDGWRTMTASAATDKITPTSMGGINTNGNKVAFKGASLPAPLVAGRVYFVANRTGTDFQLAATSGGSVIDLTSDGTGTLYPEINALERFYAKNLKLSGSSVAGVNGLSCNLQQDARTDDVWIAGCRGYSVIIDGQISNHYNWQLNPAADAGVISTGLLLKGSGHNWHGMNMVGATGGLNSAGIEPQGAINCAVFGYWPETMVNGAVRFGSGFGLVFDVLESQAIHPTVVVPAGADVNSVGYELRGGRMGANQTLIDDQVRGFTVRSNDFTQQQISTIYQPVGNVKPIFASERSSMAKGGTSTQTPGNVSAVTIAHGLALGGTGQTPTAFTVTPANANARGAPAYYVTADGTNLTLNFASALTAATVYSWTWTAQL